MFEQIRGNQPIKEILSKSIEKGTISHSYLFLGIQGIGKRMLATEFAKKILCPNKEQEHENHPDFMYIEPDGNSIKIEQIRVLQRKIQEKPILSEKKVYMIDEADKMTIEAQNCLLKTLEEPPEFATILLIGTNEHAFLPTIKSRCMILSFQPIEEVEIKKYMEQNYGMKDWTENDLVMFQGSIGKAITLKDKQTEFREIQNMIESLPQTDLISMIELAKPLYQAKEEIEELLEYMNILLLKQAKKNNVYTNCIKMVENTKKRLKQNANYDMSIDNLLFNMWEEFN